MSKMFSVKTPWLLGSKVRAQNKMHSPIIGQKGRDVKLKKQENRMLKRRATHRGNIVPDARHAYRVSMKRYLAYAQRLEEIRRL